MEAIPKDVIECAILDGQLPQCREGLEWCEQHGNCYRCAKDIHDMLVEEVRRLKAERDRALAELDKALGEREDAMLSERNAAYNKGYDEGFASADDWYAEHAAELAEHGWVKLPVDADGEYVHVGDLMVSAKGHFDGCHKVKNLVLVKCDGELSWSCQLDGVGLWDSYFALGNLRHYHAPTVEDVLQEFVDQYAFYKQVEKGIHPDLESHKEVLRRFAAKLRLAGDEE